MQVDFNFILTLFIYSLRAIVALTWGLLLLYYSKRSRQNLPLSIIFIIMGILYLRGVFVSVPVIQPVDAYNPLSYITMILIAPFTIFYAWFSIDENHPPYHYYLQFIPFVIILAMWGGVAFSSEPQIPFCSSLTEVLSHFNGYTLHVSLIVFIIIVFVGQIVTYFSSALLKFLRLVKLYKENNLSLRSLRLLILMDFLFLSFPTVGILFLSYNNHFCLALVSNILFILFISALCLINIKLILPIKNDIDFIHDKDKKISGNYREILEKNVPRNEAEEILIMGIRQLLEEKELFRLPHLSLNDIVEELGTNRSYVSGIINAHFGCNFRQLLIRYRINAAKELLINTDMDIQSVSESVGFNTRASFYTAFKEQVSATITPNEWRSMKD